MVLLAECGSQQTAEFPGSDHDDFHGCAVPMAPSGSGGAVSGEIEFGFEEFRELQAEFLFLFPGHGDRDLLALLQSHREQVEDAGEPGGAAGAGDRDLVGLRVGFRREHDDAGGTAVDACLVADDGFFLIHRLLSGVVCAQNQTALLMAFCVQLDREPP